MDVKAARAASAGRRRVELAATFGGEVPGLTVARASLEDMYLQLVDGGSEGEGS